MALSFGLINKFTCRDLTCRRNLEASSYCASARPASAAWYRKLNPLQISSPGKINRMSTSGLLSLIKRVMPIDEGEPLGQD